MFLSRCTVMCMYTLVSIINNTIQIPYHTADIKHQHVSHPLTIHLFEMS